MRAAFLSGLPLALLPAGADPACANDSAALSLAPSYRYRRLSAPLYLPPWSTWSCSSWPPG
ncbi:MAG: hypothetical protein QXT37_11605 [Thermofilaceae archaeon]